MLCTIVKREKERLVRPWEYESINVELEDEIENGSRMVKKGPGASGAVPRGTRFARNDSFALSKLVLALRSRPWEADAAPGKCPGDKT